ncbi:MAG: amidohydrolase family protein [Acidobacteria bacterium]|nr:amidohydrolase family protein [Acidobacteriota bacterium]MBI3656842.1 amidohydrolase family protein [Acidobacteriota bacterium]
MILDSHIHVGDWNYEYYPVHCDIASVNRLLDECGIDGAIIMPTDKKQNEATLWDIEKNGRKRYWFFAWADPKDSLGLGFMNNNRARINGLKFHSGLDRVEGGIGNKVYEPYLHFAASQRLPVMVHCGRWQEMSSYKFALQAAKQYTETRFILAHLGGDFEKLKLEAPRELKAMGLTNVVFDISATREFWTIEMAIRTAGADKFVFGSDYPVMHPKMSLASVEVLSLTAEERRKLYSENLLSTLAEEK